MSNVIEQLKQARQELGIKQLELGKKLGLPQSHISKIESKKNDLRLSTLEDMACILDHELMVIPRRLIPQVHGLLEGNNNQTPRWRLVDEVEE